MKNLVLATLTLASVIALTACGDAGKTASNAAGDVKSMAGDATKAVADAGKDATKAVTDAAGKATTAAKDTVDALGGKVMESVSSAQKLLTEGKFQEAKDALKPLADLKLSADQQKIVDAIKTKIDQAMGAAKSVGADATKAVQGVIPKN